MQAVAPAEETLPAGQMVHPEALIDPGFVIVPAYPGAQIVQAETDVLPADDPVVVTPVGHAIQDEPDEEY